MQTRCCRFWNRYDVSVCRLMALILSKQLWARAPGSRQTNQFLDWETIAAVTVVGLSEGDTTPDTANEKVLKIKLKQCSKWFSAFFALSYGGRRGQDGHLSTCCPSCSEFHDDATHCWRLWTNLNWVMLRMLMFLLVFRSKLQVWSLHFEELLHGCGSKQSRNILEKDSQNRKKPETISRGVKVPGH